MSHEILENKVVWVTGAASGIGAFVADACVRSGARVVATDLNIDALQSKAGLQAWPEEKIILRQQDVVSKESWVSILADTLSQWGQVDFLINMAGYVKAQTHTEMDLAEVDRHLDINTKGLIFGSQIVGEQMRSQAQGHIINIASLAGVVATPGMSLYCASKFAVRAYSIAIAQDLKGTGVSVSVICPDAVDTPMLDGLIKQPSAAITFSGFKVLTVESVWQAILKSMKTKQIEVTLPLHRGLLAKLGNFSPAIHGLLVSFLIRLGQKKQQMLGQ